MKIYKLLIILIFIVFVAESCLTTAITANVPNADVYIRGKKVGVTPYTHQDALPSFAGKEVYIKKEGYDSEAVRIRKNKRFNVWALIGVYTVPWVMGYPERYHVDMESSYDVSPKELTDFATEAKAKLKLDLSEIKFVSFDYGKLYAYELRANKAFIYTFDEEMNVLSKAEAPSGYDKISTIEVNPFNFTGFTTNNGNFVQVETDPKGGSVTLSVLDASGKVLSKRRSTFA